MRREEYACPNGCSLPPRKKQLREYSNGTYGFDFYDFTFCPCCGSLMPYSLKKLKGFFEVYNIHAALSDAVQLIIYFNSKQILNTNMQFRRLLCVREETYASRN